MTKIFRNVKRKISRMERGQVLVVVALAAIGIIAIIGLVMDVGLMFIGNARLRRAVDSAAISAALQYRQGFDTPSLTSAAEEFIVLNGFGFTNAAATVDDCQTQPLDTTLCTDPPRKLVRVHATADVKLAFLPVLGIDSVPISASATSETASLDVVLAIDTSESMTYGDSSTGLHPVGDPMRDPAYCNDPSVNGLSAAARTYTSNVRNPIDHTYHQYVLTSACQPFSAVIGAAIDFTSILLFPYDRMSIVTFDKEAGIPSGSLRVPNLELGQSCPDPATCTADTAVIPALRGLTVFQGADSYNHAASITEDYRCYHGGTENCSGNPATKFDACAWDPVMGASTNYQGLIGQKQDPCIGNPDPLYTPPYDPSTYTTTNIGYGLEMAGKEFTQDSRQDVLFVVILLTDGVPNAGHADDYTAYYCPESTWGNLNLTPKQPLCANANAVGTYWTKSSRPADTNGSYDALSYAFDQADYVGLPFDSVTQTGGQDALIYTVGLGSELSNYKVASFEDPATGAFNEGLGTIFLNYAAMVGRGQFYAAPTSTQLGIIFREIGTNIAVRLAK